MPHHDRMKQKTNWCNGKDIAINAIGQGFVSQSRQIGLSRQRFTTAGRLLGAVLPKR